MTPFTVKLIKIQGTLFVGFLEIFLFSGYTNWISGPASLASPGSMLETDSQPPPKRNQNQN